MTSIESSYRRQDVSDALLEVLSKYIPKGVPANVDVNKFIEVSHVFFKL